VNQGWVPAGVTLPNELLAPEVIASLIRMSGGNFRLLTRLLTQIERILKVNNLDTVSKDIVAAARDSLVILNLFRLRQIALNYLRHITLQATAQKCAR
jgi:hypothetical protein